MTDADKLEKLQQEKRKWALALQSLTPGGSEFVDDPKRCVAVVREHRESLMNVLRNTKRRSNMIEIAANELLIAAEKLRAALERPMENTHDQRTNDR